MKLCKATKREEMEEEKKDEEIHKYKDGKEVNLERYLKKYRKRFPIS